MLGCIFVPDNKNPFGRIEYRRASIGAIMGCDRDDPKRALIGPMPYMLFFICVRPKGIYGH
jgi:hypothetical protein